MIKNKTKKEQIFFNIPVRKETKECLKLLKIHPNQSYDEVIKKMCLEYDKTKQ